MIGREREICFQNRKRFYGALTAAIDSRPFAILIMTAFPGLRAQISAGGALLACSVAATRTGFVTPLPLCVIYTFTLCLRFGISNLYGVFMSLALAKQRASFTYKPK